jgi:hypothetical protein
MVPNMFNRSAMHAEEACEVALVYPVVAEQEELSNRRSIAGTFFSGKRVMEYSVEEIQPNVWRVNIEGIVRVVRYRKGNMTFAPWDVTSAEGRTLWSTSSLESAFRWIQARTGQPVEALFAQALLEHNARTGSSEVQGSQEASEARKDVRAGSGTPARGGSE